MLNKMWTHSPLASLRQLTALELLSQDYVKADDNPAHILGAPAAAAATPSYPCLTQQTH